ncbi:hypothetical protein [Bifidobacterium moukalabense]|uniref:hypothetical protein n=1 Tax=Bifidobacterium moukalabense TaxID=1333651 RepID=UPI0010F62CC1|nr:hypothetical protein [Bifidobacterium moukalabense]
MSTKLPLDALIQNKMLLFSCEGVAESVIIEKLLGSKRTIIDMNHVIHDASDSPYTGLRSVKDIQRTFLRQNYDYDVEILRIIDQPRSPFRLDRLYERRAHVTNLVTHPENEILVIIKEKEFQNYQKYKSGLKASDYCKRNLCIPNVKSASFLEDYWDIDSLVSALREYRRLMRNAPNDYMLADLLK